MDISSISSHARLSGGTRPTDMPIIAKIRRGRLAALAALPARPAQAGDVIPLHSAPISPHATASYHPSGRADHATHLPRFLLTHAL